MSAEPHPLTITVQPVIAHVAACELAKYEVESPHVLDTDGFVASKVNENNVGGVATTERDVRHGSGL